MSPHPGLVSRGMQAAPLLGIVPRRATMPRYVPCRPLYCTVLYCTVLYCTAPPPAQHSFVRDILLLCGQLWRIIQLDQISTGKISARRPQHLHNGGRRRVGGLTPVTTNLTFNQNIISWLPMFIFIENICTRPRVEYLPGCSLTV